MQMEDPNHNHTALPPNYVSLADLQNRWLNRNKPQPQPKPKPKPKPQPQPQHPLPPPKKEKAQPQPPSRKREKDKNQPSKPRPIVQHVNPNPTFKFQRNNGVRPGLRTKKPQIEMGDEIDVRDVPVQNVKFQNEKTVEKKLLESEPSEIEAKKGEIDGGSELVEGTVVNDWKNVLKSEPSEMDGRDDKKSGKKKKKKKKMSGEEKKKERVEGSERENQGKIVVDDQAVEIVRRFDRICVSRSGWRDIGERRARNEGWGGAYRGFGRGERRVWGGKRIEDRRVWVKKGQVSHYNVAA